MEYFNVRSNNTYPVPQHPSSPTPNPLTYSIHIHTLLNDTISSLRFTTSTSSHILFYDSLGWTLVEVIRKKKLVERKRRRESEETWEGPAIKVPRKSFVDMAGIDKHLMDLLDLLIAKNVARGASGPCYTDPRAAARHYSLRP
jgi:hypothetical protein